MYKQAVLDSEVNRYDQRTEAKQDDLICKDEILRLVGIDIAKYLNENITVKQLNPYFKQYRLAYFVFSEDEMRDIIKQLEAVKIISFPGSTFHVTEIIEKLRQ